MPSNDVSAPDVPVKVKRLPHGEGLALPRYATDGAAGMDVLSAEDTPDGRPGVSMLLFAMDKEGVGKRLVERVGQCVLTSPTAACFNGLEAEDTVDVGGQLRYFGDGYQASKVLDGRRYWRVPVMEGEFLVQERFGVVEGVAGGNIIIFARRHETG